MSWVTIIWSMNASACLTLATIYCLIWYRNRTVWSHLLFAATAVSTTGLAFCELNLMRAETVAEVVAARTLLQVPLFFWLASLTWFVWHYLAAGPRWLAWTICALRAATLLVILVMGHDPEFSNITSVRRVQFLGEQVTVIGAAPTPITPVTQLTSVLVLIFVASASVTAWRRGDRRKAVMVGGTVELFVLGSLGLAMAAAWGDTRFPFAFSILYLGLVAVMGYELCRDVLRASQLVNQLQISEAGLRESEARMSLAVDAAGFGIWIRDLRELDTWASTRWRELFGFGPSEPLQFDTILNRLHPDDREGFQRAHATAIADPHAGRYQTEYRVVLPNGTTRWISSMGRVERDPSGQPRLIRGAARDITASKRADLAVRTLSGRLLSAQEEERRRIARELHDNVSQQVASLAIRIDHVASRPIDDQLAMTASMRDLRQRTVAIATEIHGLSHQLHSNRLEMLGLVDALRGHCHELEAHGLNVHLQDENVPAPLSNDVALCLFRIAQEGLNNVAKHSAATEAHVTLRGDGDALVLSITDRGRGFDDAGAAVHGGLGLASMRERLRLLDGELIVRSQPGNGTTIVARVPIHGAGTGMSS